MMTNKFANFSRYGCAAIEVIEALSLITSGSVYSGRYIVGVGLLFLVYFK